MGEKTGLPVSAQRRWTGSQQGLVCRQLEVTRQLPVAGVLEICSGYSVTFKFSTILSCNLAM